MPKVVELKQYPGYGVSRDGRVWSRRTKRGQRKGRTSPRLVRKWHELATHIIRGKYRHAQLTSRDVSVMLPVYKLVLAGFVRPPRKGDGVHFKNGDSTDCRLANLEWRKVTRQGSHRINHRTLTESDVIAIRKKRERGALLRDLANEFNVSPTTVGDAASRRSWRHVA